MIGIPGKFPLDEELSKEVCEFFSEGGTLSVAKNYEVRPQQIEMAKEVAATLLAGDNLIVEAPTGIGKSFAYLVPAILYARKYRKKAIVSTFTINLQEQLAYKDLPILERLISVPFTYAILKGRHNYLCTRRLYHALQNVRGLFTGPEAAELERIYEWSKSTEDGSVSDLVPEPDPAVWEMVHSERGLCSPKLCGRGSPFAKSNPICFYQRAREKFLQADVIILNHMLFFSLLGGLDEDAIAEGGLIFQNDFVIFDEAHQVPHVAAKLVGASVSNTQLKFALNRLWNPRTEKGLLSLLRAGATVKLVSDLLQEVEKFFARIEEVCEEIFDRSGKNPYAFQVDGDQDSKNRWSEVRVRHPEIVPDTLSLPIQNLREKLASLVKECDDEDLGKEILEISRRLGELREGLALFLSQSQPKYVYWVERTGKLQRTIQLNAAPIDVADFLREAVFKAGTSVIMTSGTLSIPKSLSKEIAKRNASGSNAEDETSPLSYFASRVGGESARLLVLDSPFDYEKQMKVYIVGSNPDPRSPEFIDHLEHWIKYFVEMTNGKAFVLFTNLTLLQEIAKRLESFFRENELSYYVQGAGIPRSTMLERFKEDVNSVLLGADSFWQGVDVPGESLSNVIITRLPFAVPDHPLIQARIEEIEARGGDAFIEYTLPEAVLKFKQGVGRLIRTKTDKGIVVVLDSRILTKSYGRVFLEALPKCPIEIV